MNYKIYKSSLFNSIIFLALISIFFSCSGVKVEKSGFEKAKLFDMEIAKLSCFSTNGNCKVQYKNSTIRGTFKFSHNNEKFRFEIFDKSIISLVSRGILFGIYIDNEIIQIKLPGSQKIDSIDLNTFSDSIKNIFFEGISNLIQSQKKEIIKNNKTTIFDAEILFNNKMQLTKIILPDEKIEINCDYSKNDELLEILISHPEIKLLQLELEKIFYSGFDIEPLQPILK